MEKTEAVSKLRKAGYQVQFDSSIVTVLLKKKANVTQEIKKLKSYLQEIGYDASFGVKQIRGEELTDEDEKLMLEDDLTPTVDQEADMTLETEELTTESEEKWEIGEQFSLEDFGIS